MRSHALQGRQLRRYRPDFLNTIELPQVCTPQLFGASPGVSGDTPHPEKAGEIHLNRSPTDEPHAASNPGGGNGLNIASPNPMSAALTSIQDTHDVQASPDLRRIPINKVGVKGIRHPVLVKDRSSGFQHTVADFNMYVSLPQDFKGTHMSRFVEILSGNEHALSVESFRGMVLEVASRRGAETGYIEINFT